MTREDLLSIALDAEQCGRWQAAMDLRLEAAREFPRPPLRLGCEHPFGRGQWSGNLVSLDGASTQDVSTDDIDVVLAYGETKDDWDGDSAGIVELKDGRFVAWESWWGPTGAGFGADAYGGDADIAFATTSGAALAYLSEKSRELLKWA